MKASNNKQTLIRTVIFISVLSLLSGFVYLYQGSKDKFALVSHSSIGQIPKETVYLGYNLKWYGVLTPTINAIKIIKNDGTDLQSDDRQLSVEVLIDETGITGALKEADVQEDKLKYTSIDNYTIDSDRTTLVLKVNIHDSNYKNNIQAMEIQYTILGLRFTQRMEYSGLLSSELNEMNRELAKLNSIIYQKQREIDKLKLQLENSNRKIAMDHERMVAIMSFPFEYEILTEKMNRPPYSTVVYVKDVPIEYQQREKYVLRAAVQFAGMEYEYISLWYDRNKAKQYISGNYDPEETVLGWPGFDAQFGTINNADPPALNHFLSRDDVDGLKFGKY